MRLHYESALAGVLAAMATLSGCGSAPSPVPTTVVAPRSNVPDSVATRPIATPLVFRLAGYQKAGASLDATRRYAVAWRLNRDPHASLTARQMDIIGTPGRFGSYSLAGYEVAESGGVSRFKGRNCFGSVLTATLDPVQGRRLNAVPSGGQVQVVLRPLTPAPRGTAKSAGGWALTKRYVFHPKLRTADYELSDTDALRQLATIGCSHVPRKP
jgi:hypothetical protein